MAKAKLTPASKVRVGERWHFNGNDWTILRCDDGIATLTRQEWGKKKVVVCLVDDLFSEGARLRPSQRTASAAKILANISAFTRTLPKNTRKRCLPAWQTLFNMSPTGTSARGSLFGTALSCVNLGIDRKTFLAACAEEFTEATKSLGIPEQPKAPAKRKKP